MTLSKSEVNQILVESLEIKKDILKMIYKAQSGHPGGSLSCSTLLYLLYLKIMKINPNKPNWKDRDIFILSKGHAAPALYAVLSKIGFIKRDDLFTLRQFGSKLQGHPIKNRDLGIEISTGSLGMGLSIGVGCALAAKLDKKKEKFIYILLGDGELNEGSIWEAAMSASHYKLDNLIAVIDRNGIQIDGFTEEIMGLEPLAEKWKAFGWNVIEVDGSNINEIINEIKEIKNVIGRPTIVISYLIKGADVSFMQHSRKYHGRAPNKEEYEIALKEIDNIQNKLRNEIN